jgi:hypothetical protein
MIRTVVETEKLIPRGIKSVDVFIYREDSVVVSALAVFGLVEDGGTDDFHFTGGKIALEVAFIIIRIPEAPFHIREQLEILCGITFVSAQKPAEIKFEKTTHNFGKFSEKDPVVSCTFAFTNVGDQPLIINQAVASCGCTVPEYTKSPIKPGEHGSIKVTYNGKGKHPGRFRKVITVRSNAKENKAVNLYIQGEMTPVEEKQN